MRAPGLSDVLDRLAAARARLAARQLGRGPDAGAVDDDDAGLGVPDPSHVGTGLLVFAGGVQHLLGGDADGAALRDAERGLAFVARAQLPTGRFDLAGCNWDSEPDTAFLVQAFAALLLRAQGRTPSPGWSGFAEGLAAVTRRAALGLADGGFHTPNHRWVVASALALALRLWPGLPLRPTLDALVAEGPDIDDEGCFIERSIAIYDAVCARSLLLVDELVGWPAGRDAVLANLRFDLGLLHADWSAETGLSHRQDHGTRVVPDALAAPLVDLARRTGDPAWAAAAAGLWTAARAPNPASCAWLALALDAHGPLPAPAALPPLTRWYPRNGVWRHRAGALSASAFTGTRLLALRAGAAELASLSCGLSWFGAGRFCAVRGEQRDGALVLHSPSGSVPGREPSYRHPVGRPVPKEAWDDVERGRPRRRLAEAAGTLAVRPLADGLAVDLAFACGRDGVTGQLALDFPAGGVWEWDGGALRPQPGQVLFLTSGTARMRVGADWIRVGPGLDGHRMWAMRDFPPQGDLVRVVIPFRTPLAHRLTLTIGTDR